MKSRLFYLMIILSLLFSCKSDRMGKRGSEILNSKSTTLVIKGDIKNLLQVDSIFTDIIAIPLETNDKCLITQIDKVLVYQEKILLKDQSQKLYIFNINGKFLYEVARQGGGPGEFSELRDFDIDKEGNIYILQYEKILKYNIDGKFLQSFPFSFTRTGEIYCNPLDFALGENGNFYLWGGSLGIKSNPEKKLFAMYEMTKEGNILNKYFPLTHILDGEWVNRFKRYKNLIIMNPVFGSNTVYSFDSLSVNERYYIDFGKKTLDLPVPEDFNSIRDFRIKVDQSYYHSISKFIEVDDWIFFMFVYQMHVYNIYFSKKLDRSFLSRQYPFVIGLITPWTIDGSYNKRFISIIDAKYIIQQRDKCNGLDYKVLPSSLKENLDKLKQIKVTDNPVLLFCSLKKY